MGAKRLFQSTTVLPEGTRRFQATRDAFRAVPGVEFVVTQSREQFIAYDLEGTEKWRVPSEGKTLYGWSGDRFIARDDQEFLVVANGEITARGTFVGDEIWRVAVVHDQPAMVSVDSAGILARYSLEDGSKLGEWDLTEDYDFGRRGVELAGLAAVGELVYVVNSRDILELDHGELNRLAQLGGANIPDWGSSEWCISADGRFLVEASSEFERGLVAYDLSTLEVVAQVEGASQRVHGAAPGVVGWWHASMSRWAPPSTEVDWREGGWGGDENELSSTGELVTSITSRREVLVWNVDAQPRRDEAPVASWPSAGLGGAYPAPEGPLLGLQRIVDERYAFSVLDLARGEFILDREVEPSESYDWVDDSHVLITSYTDEGTPLVRVFNVVDTNTVHEGTDRVIGAGAGWALIDRQTSLVVVDPITWEARETFERPEGVEEIGGTGRPQCVTYYDEEYTTWIHDLRSGHRLEGDQLHGDYVVEIDWVDGDEVHYVRRIGSDEVLTEIHGAADEFWACKTQPGILFRVWEDDVTRFVWWNGEDTRICNLAPEGEATSVAWSADDQHVVVIGPKVRVWSRDDFETPVAEIEPLSVSCDLARMCGDRLFLADPSGNWEVWQVGRGISI